MGSSASDKTGIKLGMWLFIYTEIMLFGGLFILYAAYYTRYTNDFIEYGKTLDVYLGTLNTIVLLISSFTVAAAITAIQKKEQKLALTATFTSIFLGMVFLVNKYFEWGHKFEDGIYPGSSVLAEGGAGKNIFFGLYYMITGLHGIHIVIGLVLLSVSLVMIYSGRINADRFVMLENSGLYWHLVDLIWVFIFPLFYLIL
jgi:cytochrome c oxidase subunit III